LKRTPPPPPTGYLPGVGLIFHHPSNEVLVEAVEGAVFYQPLLPPGFLLRFYLPGLPDAGVALLQSASPFTLGPLFNEDPRESFVKGSGPPN